MKQFLLFVPLIITISLSALSQDNSDWLIDKIKSADAILLVSHDATSGVSIADDSTGMSLPLPKLIIAGKPNYSIIKERKIVTGGQLDTLSKILASPLKDRRVEIAKCFEPHHAIFLIKNGKTSYFDICFGCHRFVTSKDLSKINVFDSRKWTELENFFVRLDFKYKLNTKE